MKIITRIVLSIIIALIFNSCSVSFGGIVALDNSFRSDRNEIERSKLPEIKKGTQIIIETKDHSAITGTFNSFSEDSSGSGRFSEISLMDSTMEERTIKLDEIISCSVIREKSSIWSAVAVGAVLDAVIIYTFSRTHESHIPIKVF